jgi:hypothetical protein
MTIPRFYAARDTRDGRTHVYQGEPKNDGEFFTTRVAGRFVTRIDAVPQGMFGLQPGECVEIEFVIK